MVQVPPLNEAAYSQVRAALEDRAKQIEKTMASTTDDELLDYWQSAQFFTNDAILTMANAEEWPEQPADATWTSA